jgi:hypothetical protein
MGSLYFWHYVYIDTVHCSTATATTATMTAYFSAIVSTMIKELDIIALQHLSRRSSL